jgi:hypothetical protein
VIGDEIGKREAVLDWKIRASSGTDRDWKIVVIVASLNLEPREARSGIRRDGEMRISVATKADILYKRSTEMRAYDESGIHPFYIYK